MLTAEHAPSQLNHYRLTSVSFGALVAVLAAHKDFSAPLKELLKYYQTLEDVRVRFEEMGRYLSARTSGLPANSRSAVRQAVPASGLDRSQIAEKTPLVIRSTL
jgi:hypothetical protein